MADQQGQPNDGQEPAAHAPDVTSAADAPPANNTAANNTSADDSPADKAPAKKAPVKKAPAKKPAAKKAAAKKAPAKKAPAKKAQPAGPPPVAPLPHVATNGSSQVSEGAKEAAAQAKSTVDQASNPVRPPDELELETVGRSPVPFVVAIAMSLLALLLVRRLRQQTDQD